MEKTLSMEEEYESYIKLDGFAISDFLGEFSMDDTLWNLSAMEVLSIKREIKTEKFTSFIFEIRQLVDLDKVVGMQFNVNVGNTEEGELITYRFNE